MNGRAVSATIVSAINQRRKQAMLIRNYKSIVVVKRGIFGLKKILIQFDEHDRPKMWTNIKGLKFSLFMKMRTFQKLYEVSKASTHATLSVL